jgi:carbon starvation protein
MTLPLIPVIAASAVLLVIAYVVYGRLIVRWLGVDRARPTPAVELEDGNDYVPAPAPVVLGGHFTAIAAAGPVVGPILAGLWFGWVPALLWILLGSIFIGGVHDSGALFASIRHRAASITQVVREHMSRWAYVLFLVFVWLSLIYVVIAFADVTAGTFANFTSEIITLDGAPHALQLNGGAVVIGATAYLVLSIAMGLLLRFTRTPWWLALAGAVLILALCIWQAPAWAVWLAGHGLPFMDTAGKDAAALSRNWDQVLLVYCFIASIVPMWLLLQPRGVIGATFLYAALAFGIIGTLIGGWSGASELAIRYPAFTGWSAGNGMWLFPFLFITIACGACSGFHSIVASGTTSKQVRSEKDIKPIAYGAMLLEAMVAVFALACVMMLAAPPKGAKPDTIYALGIGRFAAQMDGRIFFFAVSFGLLAFSSFVFDTLDVCTRLGRYVLQEITGLRGIAGGAIATALTLAAPSIYLWTSPPGSFRTFWTIFGTSNQLLAALTLVGVSVWLWRTGRRYVYALLPALFMVASTCTALVLNFLGFYRRYDELSMLSQRTVAQVRELGSLPVNMTIAAVLFCLALLVVGEAARVWMLGRRSAGGGVSLQPLASAAAPDA